MSRFESQEERSRAKYRAKLQKREQARLTRWAEIEATGGRPFDCEECGGTFAAGNDLEDVEAEAENLWGVKNSIADPSMAHICEDCFQAFMARVNMAPRRQIEHANNALPSPYLTELLDDR